MIKIELDVNDKNTFYLRIPFEDVYSRQKVKKIGGLWQPSKKTWKFVFDLRIWENVSKTFGDQLEKPAIFNYLLNQKKKDEVQFLSNKEIAEKDEDIDFEVKGVSLNGKNPLFNYQKHGINCILQTGDGFLIGDVPGLGKAEIVDNKVFTPFGRKRIGDIVVGDKVIGSDGLSHNVIGVYPQGIKPVYKVTFSDGYSIECSDEHLWSVFERQNTPKKILTVKEMLDKNLTKEISGIGHNQDKVYKYHTYYKESDGGNKWQIPIVQPIEFCINETLPIEPYLFGALLGDGTFTNSVIEITEFDEDFDEMFSGYIKDRYFNAREISGRKGERVRAIAFTMRKEIEKLGLYEKKSHEKFIPDIYKYSSIEDRLSLVQGLMDTDGYCQKLSSKRNNSLNFQGTQFCSTSQRLVDDLAEIVQSLGGVVRKHSKNTFYMKDGIRHDCKRAYRLNIKMSKQFNPFRLKRKAEAYHIPQKYEVARMIKDISYIGEKECVCIAVDAVNHLYVTEHAIVTHNTIQGIGIAIQRRNRGLISNCLIVCPASLKYNWFNEIKKFTNETVLVVDGTKEERIKKWFAKGYFFKITNYETVVCDLFQDTKGKSKSQRIDGADAVLSSFDFLIVDEVHYLKSVSSQRSRAMKQFKCKYRLGLTGTPIDGKLEDVQALFDFIKPGLFPSRSKFLARYADLDYWGAVKRYKNVQEVKDKINPYYLRRTKDVVLKDLPPKIFKDVYVELPSREMKLYKDILKGKTKVTEESEAAVLMMRLRQFCDFPEILDFRNPSAKFAALEELLEELIDENKEKVVIFTQYKTVLDLLYKNLKDKYNILQIHGDVKTKDRVELCERFNNDPRVNIMLGDDAMSVGLNMQNGNAVIHYEDNFSPAVMQQRNDRCHRANTRHNVTVYRFVVKDTVEEKIRELLEKKMKVINTVLDENCNEFETTGKITNLEIISNL